MTQNYDHFKKCTIIITSQGERITSIWGIFQAKFAFQSCTQNFLYNRFEFGSP